MHSKINLNLIQSNMATTQKTEWEDISNEEYRKYAVVTPMGVGEIRITKPKGLKEEEVKIGENGFRTDHVIIDESGEIHRIQGGWLKISWKLKGE